MLTTVSFSPTHSPVYFTSAPPPSLHSGPRMVGTTVSTAARRSLCTCALLLQTLFSSAGDFTPTWFPSCFCASALGLTHLLSFCRLFRKVQSSGPVLGCSPLRSSPETDGFRLLLHSLARLLCHGLLCSIFTTASPWQHDPHPIGVPATTLGPFQPSAFILLRLPPTLCIFHP